MKLVAMQAVMKQFFQVRSIHLFIVKFHFSRIKEKEKLLL